MFYGILVLMLVLLAPLTAGAQPPTFTFVAPLDILADGRLISFAGLAHDQTLAGNTGGGGSGPKPLSYRIAAGTHALTPIVCPAATFPRYPNASRGGPFLHGMNDLKTVVGDDQHASGISYGIIQQADGTCTAYLHPGSVGTVFRGISNASAPTPFVVGTFWNAANLPTEPGLLRFHNFLMTDTGVLIIDGPQVNDRNNVMGWNTAGQVIFWAQRSIQANNTFVYQGGVRQADGTLVDLGTPTGGDFCPRAINDSGIVVGTAGRCDGAVGGASYWVDTLAPTITLYALPLPPSPVPTGTVTHIVPRAISTGGALAGSYSVRIPTGQPPPSNFRTESHGFLALPQAPPPAPPPEEPPAPPKKTQWWQFWKKTRYAVWEHWRDVRDLHAARGEMADWRWALDDDDATVVLVGPGGRVFGRETGD